MISRVMFLFQLRPLGRKHSGKRSRTSYRSGRSDLRKTDFSPIMKQIHTIRLKGPWDYTWLEPARDDEREPTANSGRVQAPVSWNDCFGPLAGCVRWSRRFQSPTNLESHERVLLDLNKVRGIERVSLNGSELQMFLPEKFERKYDLTDGLHPSNLIEIETRHSDQEDPSRSGLWCPVVIEIWSIQA